MSVYSDKSGFAWEPGGRVLMLDWRDGAKVRLGAEDKGGRKARGLLESVWVTMTEREVAVECRV